MFLHVLQFYVCFIIVFNYRYFKFNYFKYASVAIYRTHIFKFLWMDVLAI